MPSFLFVYDELGHLFSVTDPENNTITYQYDALGRKISETNDNNNITDFTYDSRGNLIRLQDANGGYTYFTYDLSGRLLKETKPLLQETVYTYDKVGNLETMVDANGRKTRYSNDNNNRLIKSEIFNAATDSNPVKTTSYSYNDAGSLTGYDDSTTSATYSHDDMQRRVSESVNYGSFTLSHSYSYYGNGLKKSYTDPAGRIRNYTYDKAGKPLGVDLGTAGMVSYNSYNWNRPNRITLPGGSTLNFSYNGLQQPTAITGKDPAENPVIDYNYNYSPSGNVTSKKTEHGDYNYDYDNLYRLNEVEGPDEQQSYGYDPLGNRTSTKDSTDWDYNTNNQLGSYNTTSFTYDNHGNMVEKSVAGNKTGYSYTVDNRLEKITDNSGATTATYYFDPYGRRLFKEVSGVRTYFHYNDEGLVGEYNATGEELRTYCYQPGSPWSTNPLFIQEGGEYYWYQNDHLGTPQKIIASNGTTVWSARYDSYGLATVIIEIIKNNLRFAGQYFDFESGLHYNWHRFYAPETGRYISVDPIGLGGGINLYAYVGGDPVDWVDPWGLAYSPAEHGGRYEGGKGGYVSLLAGGGFHWGLSGYSAMSGVAIDSCGTICFEVKHCGYLGPGGLGELGLEAEAGSGRLSSGTTESSGGFAKGGKGLFGGTSVTKTKGKPEMSVDHSLKGGVGGGGAAGYITCKTWYFCVNE